MKINFNLLLLLFKKSKIIQDKAMEMCTTIELLIWSLSM